MKLSRFTDYSLRVLLYLVINDKRLSTLHEIADFYPVSFEHLRKVVHQLSRSGYVKTYKGKHGGIELARPPEEIYIGTLIREFEGHNCFIECQSLGCRLAPFCTLREVLQEGYETLFEKLDEYTLYDLMAKKGTMREALMNPVSAPQVVRVMEPEGDQLMRGEHEQSE